MSCSFSVFRRVCVFVCVSICLSISLLMCFSLSPSHLSLSHIGLLSSLARSLLLLFYTHKVGCVDATTDLVLTVVEYICLVVFLLEMTIKMTAVGLFTKRTAYFRDGWNIMDFIAVAPGVVALIVGGGSVSALRTFRVLRPLKTLTSFTGLRQVVRQSEPPNLSVGVACLLHKLTVDDSRML